VEFTHSRHL